LGKMSYKVVYYAFMGKVGRPLTGSPNPQQPTISQPKKVISYD